MLQAGVALDVDHFILSEGGDCLQVNPRWLQHVQVTHLACHARASRILLEEPAMQTDSACKRRQTASM